ncbi:hypothetical protein JOF29_001800 [Kribbella aluminosa]|uniref:Uncharacterized protein n=1 Tax=Kribbella aluminosa TaxID=416017 RepID=A0ABS4UGF1_9ACTN|nr:hypothetical protein [Kribbella aluminosa]
MTAPAAAAPIAAPPVAALPIHPNTSVRATSGVSAPNRPYSAPIAGANVNPDKANAIPSDTADQVANTHRSIPAATSAARRQRYDVRRPGNAPEIAPPTRLPNAQTASKIPAISRCP